ncbi:MAG: hypothetical protein ACK5PS_16660, partial [Desulfopila sp.]
RDLLGYLSLGRLEDFLQMSFLLFHARNVALSLGGRGTASKRNLLPIQKRLFLPTSSLLSKF